MISMYSAMGLRRFRNVGTVFGRDNVNTELSFIESLS